MISDVIVNKSKSVLFLGEIQRSDNGIIKVYKDEKFIGFIVYNSCIWVFSRSIGVTNEYYCGEDTLIELNKHIVSDFGNVTYKFESIDE